MKKSVLTILVLFVLAFHLSACAGSSQSANSQPVEANNIANQPAEQAPANTDQPIQDAHKPDDGSLPLAPADENAALEEMQIIIGSLMLQGTDLAITAQQAEALIPLLTEVKTLTETMMPVRGEGAPQQGQEPPEQPSEEEMTKIQEQFEDLYAQIKAVFTNEQLQAIADMDINRDTISSSLQALGIEMVDPRRGAGMGDGQAAPQGEPPSGGERPAGGPGQGVQPPADGQAPADGQMVGTPPTDGNIRGGMMISADVIDAIITYLGTLAAS